MIEEKNISVFDAGTNYLVNPVNCQGVMGAGLALEFKKRYPEMYKQYRHYCLLPIGHKDKFDIGCILKYEESGKTILCFPTKKEYSKKSECSYIFEGLVTLNYLIKELRIKDIAIPLLGCSLGGLDEIKVKKMIRESLEEIEDCNIIICTYRHQSK